jgi:V8-like Glu-specific endopeptidase
MGVLRSFSALTVGALVSVTLASVSPTTADAGAVRSSTAVASESGSVVAAPQPARTAREVRRYWTRARMAAAVPIEELVPSLVVASTSRADAPRRTPERAGVRTPQTAGKLFFNVDGGAAVCSAAAIKTEKRNQVITAGHCVHTGPNPGGLLFPPDPHYYSDWLFVPRYRNGAAPFGRWVANGAWAFPGWIENESFKFDQAIITFRKRHGRRLVDVVGGNEVVWGKDARQWGTRIWGWPAESPYDGETPQRCDGRTTPFEGSADAAMYDCPLNGGASGGPWFLPRGRTANTGRIWAVTSRRVIGEPILLARPIPSEIRRMIRAANR